MFNVTETPDLHRKNQLFVVSVITGIVCFGIISFEYFIGNHVWRPGYTVAGVASILSSLFILSGRYSFAVYLCSLCFALAIGLGIFFGPGFKNAIVWFPVFVFFHLYFFNRRMTILSMFYCFGLLIAKMIFMKNGERSEILLDSIASLGLLTLFALSISGSLDKLLADKDLLLRELSHRVRNNLQVILDMVSLLQDSNESFDTRIALQTLERRVIALSAVHAVSQNSEDVQRISIGEVVENYLNRIVSKYKALPEIDPLGKHLLLDVKDANLLLLILGEIISTVTESVTTHIEDVRISFKSPTLETFQLQVEGANLSEGEWSSFSRLLLNQHGGDLRMDLKGTGKILATFGMFHR